MKGKIILPNLPQLPKPGEILLPKDAAEKIQARLDGRLPSYRRRIGSSSADFDALRTAQARRERRRRRNLLLKHPAPK